MAESLGGLIGRACGLIVAIPLFSQADEWRAEVIAVVS